MSFDFNSFNPSEHNSDKPVPSGNYRAIIDGAKIKDTRAGTGKYLELEFTIIEGQHKGRKAWNIYNIDNPNQVATQIAKQQLAAVCRATNLVKLTGEHDFLNKTLIVKLGQEEYNGEMKNKVKGYAPNSGQSTPEPKQENDSSSDSKPWLKK